MIILNLQCTANHPFEGWFASVEAFDRQAAADLVACPLCGDKQIARLPSGPRVMRSGDAEPGSRTGTRGAAQAAAQVMRALTEMVNSSEDVAERFPEEARRIHYGETEARSIRGQATAAETRELLEEGIAVLPVPLPAKEDIH